MPDLDVIGREERPAPPPVPRAVRALAGLAAATAAAGVLAVVRDEPPAPPAPPEVAVVPAGGSSTADGDGAVGVLALDVVNRSDRAVSLAGLRLDAPGVRTVGVQPAPQPPLAAGATQRLSLRYAVPDCGAAGVGSLRFSVLVDGAEVDERVVRLSDPADVDGAVPFAPCPPGSVPPPALAVRPLGGETTRTADGARGEVRLEVRNGGPPLSLLSVTAEVPGVRFTPLVPANSVVLLEEERIELALAFEVPDCARLRRTGRLVLRTARAGVVSELGLTITNDREAGTLRQVALDRVLQACPR